MQKVVRTDNNGYKELNELLDEGYIVKHITPCEYFVEYILEKNTTLTSN